MRWVEGLRRLAAGALLGAAAQGAFAAAAPSADLDVRGVLGGEADAGFARALEPRPFEFPADHGPHDAFRSEWWYLTLDLRTADGRPAGAQFTLFRQALAPPGAVEVEGPESAWRTRQVWMAHVAVTSPEGDHRADERIARDALGVAGVTAAPFAAWLDDWRLASTGAALLPARLTFAGSEEGVEFGIDVELAPGRPLVLQGDAGLSRKGEAPGNASYYYSFTRMPVAGTLRLGDRRWTVDGLGWLDREWSTSVLEPGQRGWDWFALHLDDGRDLMLYRIRRDPGATPRPTDFAGTLVHPDGRTERLEPGPDALEPIGHWRDERGTAWPVRWRLSLPSIGVEGRVSAVADDQLDRLSVRYWEGLVCLEGTAGGCGYLEMTGYGAADPGN